MVPEWVSIVMDTFGDEVIGFQDDAGAEELTALAGPVELATRWAFSKASTVLP